VNFRYGRRQTAKIRRKKKRSSNKNKDLFLKDATGGRKSTPEKVEKKKGARGKNMGGEVLISENGGDWAKLRQRGGGGNRGPGGKKPAKKKMRQRGPKLGKDGPA